MDFSHLGGSPRLGLFVAFIILLGAVASGTSVAKEPKKWPLLTIGLIILILSTSAETLLFALETLAVKGVAVTAAVSDIPGHLYAELLRLAGEVGVGLIAAGLCLPTSDKTRAVILHLEDADGELPKEQLYLSGSMPAYRPGDEIVLFLTRESGLRGQVVEVKHNVSIAERENGSNQVHVTVIYRRDQKALPSNSPLSEPDER